MKDEDKLVLSRKYFYGGFALLPFLWFVNAIWFFREAFLRKPVYDQQKAIKGYVVKSMVSCCQGSLVRGGQHGENGKNCQKTRFSQQAKTIRYY